MSESTHSSFWLVVVTPNDSPRAPYSLETAADLTGIHPDLLRYYCRTGLMGADRSQSDPDLQFDDHDLYGIRRIDRWRREHGVNFRALPLVYRLSEDLERVRADLRFLRDR